MKKTYKNPSMEVITIETNQMLASSPNPGFTTTGSTNTMESRGFDDDWDDEEDW